MCAPDLKECWVNPCLFSVRPGWDSCLYCHPWLPDSDASRRLHALEAEVELRRGLG